MLDCRCENLPRLIQVAPRIEHAIDLGAILGPLLDFLIIAVFRDQRIVSLFIRPVGHYKYSTIFATLKAGWQSKRYSRGRDTPMPLQKKSKTPELYLMRFNRR